MCSLAKFLQTEKKTERKASGKKTGKESFPVVLPAFFQFPTAFSEHVPSRAHSLILQSRFQVFPTAFDVPDRVPGVPSRSQLHSRVPNAPERVPRVPNNEEEIENEECSSNSFDKQQIQQLAGLRVKSSTSSAGRFDLAALN